MLKDRSIRSNVLSPGPTDTPQVTRQPVDAIARLVSTIPMGRMGEPDEIAKAALFLWNVLTIKRPGLVRDLPPGKEELMWVGNSSTLICGERDAILVDTFLTTEQSQTLLDWIVASGKNLTAIYITRGTAIISLAWHRFWSVSRAQGRSRHPRSSRPCMSICHPTGSRTSGDGFSRARF